jgi:hypothetical protein
MRPGRDWPRCTAPPSARPPDQGYDAFCVMRFVLPSPGASRSSIRRSSHRPLRGPGSVEPPQAPGAYQPSRRSTGGDTDYSSRPTVRFPAATRHGPVHFGEQAVALIDRSCSSGHCTRDFGRPRIYGGESVTIERRINAPAAWVIRTSQQCGRTNQMPRQPDHRPDHRCGRPPEPFGPLRACSQCRHGSGMMAAPAPRSSGAAHRTGCHDRRGHFRAIRFLCQTQTQRQTLTVNAQIAMPISHSVGGYRRPQSRP